MKNDANEEIGKLLVFETHEAGIRVEAGFDVMMAVDRLVEIEDDDKRQDALIKLLSGE